MSVLPPAPQTPPCSQAPISKAARPANVLAEEPPLELASLEDEQDDDVF